MLALFPGAARIAAGVLEVDGTPVTALAERLGTPLVVYSEEALRERARMFRRAVPDALVAYGTKAFPNVAVMRLLAEEGIGADVSTLGELTFARRAGIDGARLLVHGNNKSDEELRAAAEADALVVLDALDEPARAAATGVRRVLVRVTPGVDADTHASIRTGHHGSKFGLDPDGALEAVRTAREAGLEVEGLHLHVGSQLADAEAHLLSVRLLALPGRRGQARRRPALRRDRRRHVRQPAPAALRGTLLRAAGEPGRRGGGGRLHHRRQALRVGRCADRQSRAARAEARRPDRRPRHRRIHARDGVELQRRPQARRGARRRRRGPARGRGGLARGRGARGFPGRPPAEKLRAAALRQLGRHAGAADPEGQP